MRCLLRASAAMLAKNRSDWGERSGSCAKDLSPALPRGSKKPLTVSSVSSESPYTISLKGKDIMRKVILTVAVCATVLSVGTAQAAGTPQQKCQQAKLKAQGKLKNCLAKNASGVIVGKADESAECQTKFTTALGKADAKASEAGTSCRYIDNGDGTVSDLNTGLVWEQKTAGGTHDVNATYLWSSSGPASDGSAFTVLLGTLNGENSSDGTNVVTACFTGHCDWRLPTIQELQGIVDLTATGCGMGNPCIDPAFGPTQSGFYWSGTDWSGISYHAWYVDFYTGAVFNLGKTNDFFVRAVRGGL